MLAVLATLAVTLAGIPAAVCAPSSVGFHHTTRKATAKPTITALTKKPRTRICV
jgi:hypothetical protein